MHSKQLYNNDHIYNETVNLIDVAFDTSDRWNLKKNGASYWHGEYGDTRLPSLDTTLLDVGHK